MNNHTISQICSLELSLKTRFYIMILFNCFTCYDNCSLLPFDEMFKHKTVNLESIMNHEEKTRVPWTKRLPLFFSAPAINFRYYVVGDGCNSWLSIDCFIDCSIQGQTGHWELRESFPLAGRYFGLRTGRLVVWGPVGSRFPNQYPFAPDYLIACVIDYLIITDWLSPALLLHV